MRSFYGKIDSLEFRVEFLFEEKGSYLKAFWLKPELRTVKIHL